MAAIWLSATHLHKILWQFNLYSKRYDIFFERYKICQKSDKYWIDLESLKLKGPQIEIIFTSGW